MVVARRRRRQKFNCNHTATARGAGAARTQTPALAMARALLALALLVCGASAYADPPFDLTRVLFSATFSDDMVLQRAPQAAATYGTATPGAAVTVRLAGPGGFAWASAPAAVDAGADESVRGTWKVVLPARGAGFGYSVTATCAGCPNATAASLAGIGFGDVFLCSGRAFTHARPAAPYTHPPSPNPLRAPPRPYTNRE